jgi:hypothetical protein
VERFSAGAVLSTGLRMFARVGVRYLPVILILHAPILYFHVMAHLAAPGVDQAIAAERAGEWNLLLVLLEIPIAAIVTQAVVRELRGKQPSVVDCVAAGLRRTLPALGVMLLVYLVVFALSFAIGLPAGAAAALDRTGVISVLYVIAMVAMIIAIYTRWFVAIPAIVIERPGVAGALTRSGELTEGRRLHILGVIVASNVLFVALLVMVRVLGDADYARDGLVWTMQGSLTPWLASANVAVFILFGVLRATMSAVAYYLIRTETEAQSPETLARVFD